jgi:hypothetical protein
VRAGEPSARMGIAADGGRAAAVAGLLVVRRNSEHAGVLEGGDDRERVGGDVMPHIGLPELLVLAVLVVLVSPVVVAFSVLRALVRSLRK